MGCGGRLASGVISGAAVKYDYVDSEKDLICYVAFVPSIWDFVNKKF